MLTIDNISGGFFAYLMLKNAEKEVKNTKPLKCCDCDKCCPLDGLKLCTYNGDKNATVCPSDGVCDKGLQFIIKQKPKKSFNYRLPLIFVFLLCISMDLFCIFALPLILKH